MRGTYTRWTRRSGDPLVADILGSRISITADPEEGLSRLTLCDDDVKVALDLDPDEARMIGVRLIEAAALSDADRAIRTVD